MLMIGESSIIFILQVIASSIAIPSHSPPQGLRGAMAFALSIRETSSTKDCTIFSTTLLIVMTTIVLSGGLTTQSLGWLNIKMALPATEGETRTFDSLHNVSCLSCRLLRCCLVLVRILSCCW